MELQPATREGICSVTEIILTDKAPRTKIHRETDYVDLGIRAVAQCVIQIGSDISLDQFERVDVAIAYRTAPIGIISARINDFRPKAEGTGIIFGRKSGAQAEDRKSTRLNS